jgi:hypothetical protein
MKQEKLDKQTSFMAATLFIIIGYWVAGKFAQSMLIIISNNASDTMKFIGTILLGFVMIWCCGGAVTFIFWGLGFPKDKPKVT